MLFPRAVIEEAGGLDLTILGIGRNGHIVLWFFFQSSFLIANESLSFVSRWLLKLYGAPVPLMVATAPLP